MKKVLLLLAVVLTLLGADLSPREKLLSVIAHALVPSKKPRVYIEDAQWRMKIGPIRGIVFIDQCMTADLVLTRDPAKVLRQCPDAILFLTTYRAYRSMPESVGALFWQKGRPTLLFHRKALEQRSLVLPAELRAYEE